MSQNQKEAMKKKLLRRILKSFAFKTIIIVCIGGLGIFYLLYFSPVFSATNISVQGNNEISSKEIEKVAYQELGRWRSKSLIWSLSSIQEQLPIIFPKIKTFSLTRNFPHSLNILIKERIPECYITNQNNGYSILDKEGIVIDQEKEIPPVDSWFLEIDRSLIIEPENTNRYLSLLPWEKIMTIKETINKLAYKKIVRGINISSGQKIIISTEDGCLIYFRQDMGIDNQLDKLKAMITNKEIESFDGIEYIDLSYEHRAYYKVK